MLNTHNWSGHFLGKYCKSCKITMKEFYANPKPCLKENQDYAAWIRFVAVIFAVGVLMAWLAYKITRGLR